MAKFTQYFYKLVKWKIWLKKHKVKSMYRRLSNRQKIYKQQIYELLNQDFNHEPSLFNL